MKEAAAAIADAFRRSGSISAYYPCHRVVLSLSDSDDVTAGIPETARVMEGPNDTSGYTMSLFDLAGGTGRRTWRDLLLAVDGIDAPWRHELDTQFLQALGEKLFPPIGWQAAHGTCGPGRRSALSPGHLQHRPRSGSRIWIERLCARRPPAPFRDDHPGTRARCIPRVT